MDEFYVGLNAFSDAFFILVLLDLWSDDFDFMEYYLIECYFINLIKKIGFNAMGSDHVIKVRRAMLGVLRSWCLRYEYVIPCPNQQRNDCICSMAIIMQVHQSKSVQWLRLEVGLLRGVYSCCDSRGFKYVLIDRLHPASAGILLQPTIGYRIGSREPILFLLERSSVVWYF